MRLGFRRGDGAQQALLAFTKLPTPELVKPATKTPLAPKPEPTPQAPQAKAAEKAKKPKGLIGGLRDLWERRKKGNKAS